MPLILILAVSTVLGFLTGLGVGGGSLLILWLTLFLQEPQNTARTINLLFFLPAALVACLFRHKQGTLKLEKIYPAIVAGIIGLVVNGERLAVSCAEVYRVIVPDRCCHIAFLPI